MKRGDKIRTIYGDIETVMDIEESRIITYESAQKNSWWHPSKVTPVFYAENLKKYITIPID